MDERAAGRPGGGGAGGGEVVAVLGTGVMGEAVLAGVLAGLRAGGAGGRVEVVASARRPERAAELAERHGVRVVSAREAAAADVVVLGVKPQQLDAALSEVAGAARPGSLWVSLLAGTTTARLEAALPGAAVVRAMPNTPALVGAGTTVVSAGASAGEHHLARAEALLGATGAVVRLPEALQDAATGLSGSGPAYVFAVVDALAEGGVAQGLPRAVALQLATSTVLGAATLLTRTGAHPVLAREQVSSPGGTTVAGLRELDERGLRSALVAAVAASAARSRELSAPPS